MAKSPRKSKPSYVPAPEIPPEARERYEVMLSVLSGEMSVSEGARRLELSRPRFQTLMHRGVGGLLDGLAQKPAGRPKKPEEIKELIEDNERLVRENRHLQQELDGIQRVMGILSESLRGQLRPSSRSSGSRSKRTQKTSKAGKAEEPDEEQRVRFAIAEELREKGVYPGTAAARVGSSPATYRRWRRRHRAGRRLADRRGPGRRGPVPLALRSQVAGRVRDLRGQIGADVLRMCFPGVSRRDAHEIKRATLTQMERERKAQCGRVTVMAPGVVRGFAGMHVRTTAGRRHVLVATDAHIPFRTTVRATERYDTAAVLRAVEQDIAVHGAPLAYRMDRARCQKTEPVRELLLQNDILLLHGPPRHPGYYGQLERQNREHRAWLSAAGELDPDELDPEVQRMATAFNRLLPRRILGFRTAEEMWHEREQVVCDREALRAEVRSRAARLRHKLDLTGRTPDFPERLAIEHALIHRNYLHCKPGRPC